MSLDLKSVRGATIVVLALRLYYGAILFVAQSVTHAPLQPPRRPGPPHGALDWIHWIVVNPWVHRDAVYYGRIVGHGYSVEAGTTAFHPLFPLVSWIVSLPFGSPTVGMWIVSTVSAIALTVVFARYVAEVHGDRWSSGASWALLCMPAGIVWLLLYTEAMFVAFAVVCLWQLHRRHWWEAAVFGALATLTRQQGIVLFVPVAWSIWHNDRRVGALAAAALIPLAYASFAAYRLVVLHDIDLHHISGPVAFAQALLVSHAAEGIAPGQHIAWPWQPFIGQVQALLGGGEVHLLLDLVLGAGMLAFLVARSRALTPEEKLYCAGVALVALCYYNGSLAPMMALPRHAIIAFPIGFLLAQYAEERHPRVLIAAGLAFNGLLALLYGTLRWIP